jgi:hypothetical protein
VNGGGGPVNSVLNSKRDHLTSFERSFRSLSNNDLILHFHHFVLQLCSFESGFVVMLNKVFHSHNFRTKLLFGNIIIVIIIIKISVRAEAKPAMPACPK